MSSSSWPASRSEASARNESAAARPVRAVAQGPPGAGGEQFGGAQSLLESGLGGRFGERVPVVDGEPGPDRLEAGAVGDAPALGQGTDELESTAVLGGIGGAGGGPALRRVGRVAVLRTFAAHGAGRVMVGDLQHQGRGLVLGGLLQPAQQLDVGPGVHDRVGDQLADDDRRVVGQPLAEAHGRRQSEPAPFGERRLDEPAAGGGCEEVSGQGRTGDGPCVRMADGVAGTLNDVPLQGNGPHGAAPDLFALCLFSFCLSVLAGRH